MQIHSVGIDLGKATFHLVEITPSRVSSVSFFQQATRDLISAGVPVLALKWPQGWGTYGC
jgi:hypothetical protein